MDNTVTVFGCVAQSLFTMKHYRVRHAMLSITLEVVTACITHHTKNR